MAEQRLIDANAFAEIVLTSLTRLYDTQYQKGFQDGVDTVIKMLKVEPTINAVVLPCKVGDTVWWMTGCKILKCYVARFQIAEYGVVMLLLRSGKTRCGLFPVNLIGTSLFFSEENANDALAERRADG